MSGICLCFQIVGCLLMFENKEQNKDILANKNVNDDEVESEKKVLIYKKKINSLGIK